MGPINMDSHLAFGEDRFQRGDRLLNRGFQIHRLSMTGISLGELVDRIDPVGGFDGLGHDELHPLAQFGQEFFHALAARLNRIQLEHRCLRGEIDVRQRGFNFVDYISSDLTRDILSRVWRSCFKLARPPNMKICS